MFANANDNGNANWNDATNPWYGIRDSLLNHHTAKCGFNHKQKKEMLSILNNEIKTQVDAVSHDCYGYQLPDFADANNLYSAYLKARKNSAWKRQVQIVEHEYLLTIAKLQAELANGTYKTQKGRTFEIRERGKTRVIRSNTFRDRIVRRALCDQVLNPTHSWMQNYKRLLSPRTRRNLDDLYRRLLCKYDARRKTAKKSE